MTTYLFAVVGAVAAVLLVVTARRHPGIAVLLWLLVVAFVPVWIALNIKTYVAPASIAGIVILSSLVPTAIGRLGIADLLVGMFFVASIAPVLTGDSNKAIILGLLLQWVVAYLVGRLLPTRIDAQWIYGAVAIVFTVVSLLALAEHFFLWNPFVGLGPANSLHAEWGPIQSRAGVPRVEGAFGHSIALGCSIALTLPLTLATRFPTWVKTLMVLVMLGAVAATLSRTSFICAMLAVVICAPMLRHGLTRSQRTMIVAVLTIGVVVLAPTLVQLFQQAGTEATGSGSYRLDLTALIPQISIIGISGSATRDVAGVPYFGGFQSIDSELILAGLTYGWLAILVGLICLTVALVCVLRRRGDPATIAIVAQLPALATVALITQYSMYFWFVAGLAVAAQAPGLRPGGFQSLSSHPGRAGQSGTVAASV
ncbi:MAG: hypothetical protein M3Y35_09990 [Actinomycetota bacterium]|nr:hypothetical protein [Actinomycetota bacterium]